MKIDPVEQASTNARYQAIRKAWKREQQLVWEGKGTRDWTREQQRDILNLKKGRAYDDLGRAFEGQHMSRVKSCSDPVHKKGSYSANT